MMTVILKMEAMKKRVVLAVFVTVFCLAPAQTKAAEQLGVYVTPKFVYGATVMDNTRMTEDYSSGTDTDITTYKISSGSDSVFGGSLAVGYDFHKQFDLPFRAEIEYSIFSNAKNKTTDSGYRNSGGTSSNNAESFEQKFDIQTLFLNAYYDFHTSTAFTPYIGAGLGMAFIENNMKNSYSYSFGGSSESGGFSTGSKNTSNFAWNIGAGVAYSFTENCALDLGYRFVGLGSAKTKTFSTDGDSGNTVRYQGKTEDLYMHQVAVGIRFSF